METEYILRIQSRTIQKLHQHFEAELIPDEEYVQLVNIVIEAGISILDELGQSKSSVDAFQATLSTEAKNLWLTTCLKNSDADEDSKIVTKESSAAYDRILKKQRK
jgi:hypothetical protein